MPNEPFKDGTGVNHRAKGKTICGGEKKKGSEKGERPPGDWDELTRKEGDSNRRPRGLLQPKNRRSLKNTLIRGLRAGYWGEGKSRKKTGKENRDEEPMYIKNWKKPRKKTESRNHFG